MSAKERDDAYVSIVRRIHKSKSVASLIIFFIVVSSFSMFYFAFFKIQLGHSINLDCKDFETLDVGYNFGDDKEALIMYSKTPLRMDQNNNSFGVVDTNYIRIIDMKSGEVFWDYSLDKPNYVIGYIKNLRSYSLDDSYFVILVQYAQVVAGDSLEVVPYDWYYYKNETGNYETYLIRNYANNRTKIDIIDLTEHIKGRIIDVLSMSSDFNPNSFESVSNTSGFVVHMTNLTYQDELNRFNKEGASVKESMDSFSFFSTDGKLKWSLNESDSAIFKDIQNLDVIDVYMTHINESSLAIVDQNYYLIDIRDGSLIFEINSSIDDHIYFIQGLTCSIDYNNDTISDLAVVVNKEENNNGTYTNYYLIKVYDGVTGADLNKTLNEGDETFLRMEYIRITDLRNRELMGQDFYPYDLIAIKTTFNQSDTFAVFKITQNKLELIYKVQILGGYSYFLSSRSLFMEEDGHKYLLWVHKSPNSGHNMYKIDINVKKEKIYASKNKEPHFMWDLLTDLKGKEIILLNPYDDKLNIISMLGDKNFYELNPLYSVILIISIMGIIGAIPLLLYMRKKVREQYSEKERLVLNEKEDLTTGQKEVEQNQKEAGQKETPHSSSLEKITNNKEEISARDILNNNVGQEEDRAKKLMDSVLTLRKLALGVFFIIIAGLVIMITQIFINQEHVIYKSGLYYAQRNLYIVFSLMMGLFPVISAMFNILAVKSSKIYIQIQKFFYHKLKRNKVDYKVVVLDMSYARRHSPFILLSRTLFGLFVSITIGLSTFQLLYSGTLPVTSVNIGFISEFEQLAALTITISLLFLAIFLPGGWLLDDCGVVYFEEPIEINAPGDISKISDWLLSWIKGLFGFTAIINYYRLFQYFDLSSIIKSDPLSNLIVFMLILIDIIFIPILYPIAVLLYSSFSILEDIDYNHLHLMNVIENLGFDSHPHRLRDFFEDNSKGATKSN
ncbi:MAG: hypothetical protein ACTSVC_06395 [Promethearchaeota archaeon]